MNEVGMKNGAEMAVSRTAVCEYSGVRETGKWGSGSNEEGNLSATYTVDFSFHKSEANSKLRTNIAIMYIGYQTFWSIPFATPRHHVVIMS